MTHYAEETENTETTNTETENSAAGNSSGSTETVAAPATTTEDAGEIPKPGGNREKNPKKGG